MNLVYNYNICLIFIKTIVYYYHKYVLMYDQNIQLFGWRLRLSYSSVLVRGWQQNNKRKPTGIENFWPLQSYFRPFQYVLVVYTHGVYKTFFYLKMNKDIFSERFLFLYDFQNHNYTCIITKNYLVAYTDCCVMRMKSKVCNWTI